MMGWVYDHSHQAKGTLGLWKGDEEFINDGICWGNGKGLGTKHNLTCGGGGETEENGEQFLTAPPTNRMLQETTVKEEKELEGK
jgi:hypothetical protein